MMQIWNQPAFLFTAMLLAAVVQGSPTADLNARAGCDDDEPDIFFKRSGSFTLLSDANVDHPYANTTQLATGPNDYVIDCKSFPNVCQNWCYYVNCKNNKKNTYVVTVNRKANHRPDSACRGYNRCSSGRAGKCKPRDGWAVNPTPGWSCDEQPKNTNDEGGAGAATRCMPDRENKDEGNQWKVFINGQAGNTKKDDTSKVTVVLTNKPATEYCAGKCKPPATPASNAADSVRQQ